MKNILSASQPASAPSNSDVWWSNVVIFTSGVTRKPLLTRSTVIGPWPTDSSPVRFAPTRHEGEKETVPAPQPASALTQN